MSNFKMCDYQVLATILFAVFCSQVDGQNLVVNGDFEDGNSGFFSEFGYVPGNIFGAGTYDIVTNPNNSHSSAASYGDKTSGDGLMMAVNGSIDTVSVIWSQQISVEPGTTYQLSIWTSTWFSPAGLQVRINSTDNGDEFSTPATNGEWELTTRSWNSESSGTALIEIINTTSQFGGNDFALDELSFNLIADVLLGDVNLDGAVDLLDVAPFIDLISSGEFQFEADLNGAGFVNLLDVAPFVDLLSG